jgi:hypothetical protein
MPTIIRCAVFPCLLLFCVLPLHAVEPVSTCGQGQLHRIGDYPVLVLKGTYHEMGQQYGSLLKNEILGMNETVLDVFFRGHESPDEAIAKADALMKYLFERLPKRFQDIFSGVAENTGITTERLVLIDLVYALDVLGPKMEPQEACSSIACWGDYTGGLPLIVGRNFDYPVHYRRFHSFLCVVVLNPTDGSIPTATLGYAGQVGALHFFNREGLILEMNDGTQIGGVNAVDHYDRLPFSILVLRFGLDCGTLGQLDATLRTTRIAHPFLCNVADTKTAYTYEMGTRDMIRRGDLHEGMQVVCNTPIDSHWSDVYPSETSKKRRENLLALGEKHKGSIDLECMKRIMETHYSQGGATVPTTIYQFVYEPDQRMLHIRIPSYREWTPIPLKRFFAND